jgi:type IV pilus secretin PilQ/predicted competence protein
MLSLVDSRRLALFGLVCAFIAAPLAHGAPSTIDSSLSSARRALGVSSMNGVGVEVARGQGVEQIYIAVKNPNPKFTVNKLSNPPRLVIDLQSERVTGSKRWPIADLESVSSIRLGAQASAARVVLDLSDGSDVSHEVTTINGNVVVSLRTGGAAHGLQGVASVIQPVTPIASKSSTQHREKIEVKAEPRLPEIDDSEDLHQEESVDIIEKPAVPLILPVSKKTEAASKGIAEVPAQPELELVHQVSRAISAEVQPSIVKAAFREGGISHVKSVKLQGAKGSGSSVSVDLLGKPEFSIARTAPSEYVLTVKNATVSEDALSTTLFSESQSAAIRSVRSAALGKDALVRIFAQPNVYLTARVEGETIVVEETEDLKKVVDDMRAQLAPGTTNPEKPKAMDGKDNKAVAPKVEEAPKKGNVAAKAEKVDAKEAPEEMSDLEVQQLLGDTARYTGKLISLDLQDTDIDNALRIIAEVSNLNIVASEDVVGKVTLRLTDVPWDQALDVILKTHGLDKVREGNVMRIAPIEKLRTERELLKQVQVAEAELEPLSVKYLRVSYGKASELKALVETVLSERGTVAYDERSNQLIVKDIESGIKNVTELVAKVDLRTPQVLLETQIVEASRNLSRELGSELGFQYIQSPSTGNGTGLNFPSAISVGGSAIPGAAGITGSAFPIASSAVGGSAVTMLFDSADGTKSLELRLSQLEQEGRVRIVSRPAVATTNNKPAEIKSVEKYRVKLPNGGTSVATGSGATAAGSGSNATETIEAGIILNVTPQASPDYYILLDIKAKSSSFGSKSVDGIPNEIERSASSSVLVSSGQTFALGGIYKINEADRVTGVPFFKDIPFLGTFFRRSQTDNSDEELLFFITPRIVEGSFDDATMKTAS